ncbi:MAG: hypothetical protein P8186_25930 [Anaerolineae bacterium]|jgi:hypothetical protein
MPRNLPENSMWGYDMERDLTAMGRAGLVTSTLVALGDYLREHKLVTGYGFEQTRDGVVCHFRNCRFAGVAHEIAEQGMVCARCPVFQLMEEALQEGGQCPALREHAIFADDDVTCMFHLALASERKGRLKEK